MHIATTSINRGFGIFDRDAKNVSIATTINVPKTKADDTLEPLAFVPINKSTLEGT